MIMKGTERLAKQPTLKIRGGHYAKKSVTVVERRL